MAEKTIKTIEGFVLRSSPYKESDAMMNVLSSEGLFSFLGRGVQKNTSKNFASSQLLSKAKFSLVEQKNGGYALQESEVMSLPDGKSDLTRLAIFSFIAEASVKLISEEEASTIYPWLDQTMNLLKEEGKEASSALIYFCHLLAVIGYGLEVDECVVCGKKTDIIGVSFHEGGFVCRDCGSASSKLGARDLKILRFCFKCGLSDALRVSFEAKESLALLKRLILYVEDFTGVKLKSLELI
jgi:DNA repair protein RecO (recombination protein O)